MKRLNRYIAKYGWLGFKLYLLKKIRFPYPHIVKIKIPQTKDLIILRSNTSDIDVFEHIFINEEYKFATNTEPKVIIDAGANIGLTSIYYSITYPEAQIIAIEPELSNYKLLKENIKSYPNIFSINKALWHKIAPLKISNPNDQKFSFRVEESDNYSEVKAITIDELIKQYKFSYIDILKIDIEGAEKEVFSNRPNWVSKVGMIVIELHDRIRVGSNRSFYTAIDPFVIKEFRKGKIVCVITRAGSISKCNT